jgi:hypothetical protein
MKLSNALGLSLGLVLVGCEQPVPLATNNGARNGAGTTNNAGSNGASRSADASAAASADADINSAAPVVPGGNGPVEGPTGTIEGIVRIEGPLPAPQALELPAAFSGKRGCADAARRYAQVFDVSSPGPLGGVLVSAEARAPGLGTPVVRRITVRDCDVVQRYLFAKENDIIELETIAHAPHLPVIVGTGETINQLLIPGQNPRPLVFSTPGQFPITFRDLPPFVGAMVYRLRQRFIDTTDVQGHFRITEVPVGSVVVHAWIPGAVESRGTAVVRAGETTTLDFRLSPAPVPRQPVQGVRHNDGTVRTPSGQIIPQ